MTVVQEMENLYTFRQSQGKGSPSEPRWEDVYELIERKDGLPRGGATISMNFIYFLYVFLL
jgi:hypothetical protein